MLGLGSHPTGPVDLHDPVDRDTAEVPGDVDRRPDPDEDVAVATVDRDADRRREAPRRREVGADIERLEHESVAGGARLRGREVERAIGADEDEQGDPAERHEQADQEHRDPEPQLQAALHGGHPPMGQRTDR